jgi:hypothetical protein
MTSTPKKAAKKADWESAREESDELRMKTNQNPSPTGKSPSQQIDAIISESGDWRGTKLSQLRTVIKQADPAFVEEVKWKKPSRPEGVPVWSHEGILCFCDTLKNAVRLTSPRVLR